MDEHIRLDTLTDMYLCDKVANGLFSARIVYPMVEGGLSTLSVTRRRRLTLIMWCTGMKKDQKGKTGKKFPDLFTSGQLTRLSKSVQEALCERSCTLVIPDASDYGAYAIAL